ncbi:MULTISPECIES: M15 family metallopeptidase [unclassified Agrococcus]|uniref:M15 family metallopeptidase n=1 Tax=unclassified Agrococcus TaxID=2615065 RepID=UPI00360FA476
MHATATATATATAVTAAATATARRASRARRRALLATAVVAVAGVAVPVATFEALGAASPPLPALAVVERAVDHVVDPTPGADDGALPGGPVSAWDDVPAIANLDPDLRSAVRAASDAAAERGIVLVVNSGWRSAALQQRMLDDAVTTYGSAEEAARWVSTPERSSHVTGDAVDVGGWDAAAWLAAEGWAFGLCQTYANESWHFELRPGAIANGCPAMLDDPTQAP